MTTEIKKKKKQLVQVALKVIQNKNITIFDNQTFNGNSLFVDYYYYCQFSKPSL